jgi:hypothetical protein
MDVLEDIFPETSAVGKKMNAFEEYLRCPCCGDFFDNPNSLSCGHVYCSECIRKHLDSLINTTTHDACPACKVKADAAHLRPDRAMSNLVQMYKTIRPMLLSTIETDVALGRSSDYESTSSNVCSKPQRKEPSNGSKVYIATKIPQRHFHGMAREKVKKCIDALCEGSSLKLRVDGDKDVLEKRYRDFVHLNNAQVDKEAPMSLEALVRECTKREAMR